MTEILTYESAADPATALSVFSDISTLGGSVASSTNTPSIAPITVVVTSLYTPSATTNSRGSSTSGPSASVSIQTAILSVLPLTTIFTPPASCSTRPFTLSASDNTSVGVWGYSSAFVDPCYPTDWATAKTNYYIPGACPQGHTYAGIFFGQSLSAPYTSVNCCPSGMDLLGTTQCRTLITTPTHALLPDSKTSTISSFPFAGFATPLVVIWGPGDLSKFTPSAAPAIAVAKQAKEDAGNVPTGLSIGEKAGIGVGVSVGILLSMGVLILAVFRVRRRKARRLTSDPSDGGDFKSELPGDSSVEKKTMAELDDHTESREMEGDAMFPELAHLIKSSELEVPHRVHELPG